MATLDEVKRRWSLLELVEAHLFLDWQEEAERTQRKWQEDHPSKAR